MSFRHILLRFVENELGVVLIYSVVREMHANIVHVILCRGLVLLRCKSAQTLLIQIDAERVDTCDEDIHPEIKLEAFNQIRLMHVTLDYTVGCRIYVF